jgi:uncharacterized protein HemY
MEHLYYLSYVVLIGAYIHTKQFDKARTHLDASLRTFPKKAHLRRLLGYLHLVEQRWPESAAALEEAREME